MTGIPSRIPNLKRDLNKYLESGDIKMAMMILRFLENEARIRSDVDELRFSLRQQASILRDSGDFERARKIEKELETLGQKESRTPQPELDEDERSNAVSASGQFRRTPCNSIIDTHTNLEWFVGPDVNMNQNESIAWVDKLQACGGGWRLPTIRELESLYRKGDGGGLQGNMDGIFPKLGGSFVWSGEEQLTSNVPVFLFDVGVEFGVASSRRSSCRVFAVRTVGES